MKTEFNLNPYQLKSLKEELQAYFLDELEIEIGDLKANLFIEFIQNQNGKEFYNAGVLDTIKMIKERVEDAHLLLKG